VGCPVDDAFGGAGAPPGVAPGRQPHAEAAKTIAAATLTGDLAYR